MRQFISVTLTRSDGQTILHTINTAQIVELVDDKGYAASLTLTSGAKIELDRTQAAVLRAELTGDRVVLGPVNTVPVNTVPVNTVPVATSYRDSVPLPDDEDAYRAAQCEMFATAGRYGLNSNARTAMIAAINAYLGTNITSRTQLTIRQMHILCYAIERGDLTWRAEIRKVA